MTHESLHDTTTTRLAYNWICGAGIVAILFSLFLVCSDDYLSTSTAEVEKAKTIREMRQAQASLPSLRVDDRLLRSVNVATESAAAGHASGHDEDPPENTKQSHSEH